MADIKTINSVPVAGIKTYQGIPLASLKTINALEVGEAEGFPGPVPVAGLQAWYKTDAGVWSRSGAYFNRPNAEYLTMPSNPTLQFGFIPWTICGWVWTPDVTSTTLILAKRGLLEVDYQIHMAGGGINVLAYNGVTHPAATRPITAGVWFFIVGSYDPATQLLYAQVNDGAVSASPSGGVMTNNPTHGLGFGTDLTAPATYAMTGMLQNWAFFGRALSYPERTFLYNGGAGRHYGELDAAFKTDLRAWWAFDEQNGSRVDIHNGNTLTDVNTVTSGDALILNPASDNAPVYKWSDQSGNGRDLIAAAVANRPIYRMDTRNGLPGIWFYGAGSPAPQSQWFQGSGAMTAGTILSAVQNRAPLPFGNYNGWLTAASGQYFQAFYATQTYWLYSGAALGGFARDGVGDIQVDQAWHDYEVTGTPVAISGLMMGIDRGMADRVWYGPAGETLIYDTELSAPDRVLVEDYLEERWGPFGIAQPDEVPGLKLWYKSDEGVYSKNAAYFIPANTEFLTCPHNATLSLGNIPWTIGGWIYQEAGGGTPQVQLCKFADAGGVEYQIYSQTGTPIISILTGVVEAYATEPLGSWFFYLASYDGAGTLSLQLNNGTAATAATGPPPVGSGNLYLGAYNASGAYVHKGAMQNWFIFGRLLNATERTFLYNAGAGRSYEELDATFKTNLRAWWPLDENGGTRQDKHIHANHLTDVNTVMGADGVVVNPASSNSTVYRWGDQSPAGIQVLQANTVKRPLFLTGQKNGKPSVRFDGVDDVLVSPSILGSALASATAQTVFVVQIQWLLGAGAGTYEWGPAENHIGVNAAWSDNNIYWDCGPIVGGRTVCTAPAPWLGQWKLLEYRRDGAGSQIVANGVGIGGAGLTQPCNPALTSELYVGGGVPLYGDIAEIIIFDNAINSSDWAAIRNYLNAKYAIY